MGVCLSLDVGMDVGTRRDCKRHCLGIMNTGQLRRGQRVLGEHGWRRAFFLDSDIIFFTRKKKTLPIPPTMKRIHHFEGFAQDKGRLYEEIVDTCLQAMLHGVLDVRVQNDAGQCLWECGFAWTMERWHRMCGLLQRAGIASSIVWESKYVVLIREYWTAIEYLWTDLDAVHRVLERVNLHPRWLVQELDRRQAWAAGLRRAWLAACTHV